MTNQGPCVIEVNPTAGYFVDSIDDIERMKMIVQSLKNYFSKILMIYKTNSVEIFPKNNIGLKNENFN